MARTPTTCRHAYNAAVEAITSPAERVLVRGFTITPDGSVRLLLRRDVTTLVAHDIGPLKKYTVVTAHGEAPPLPGVSTLAGRDVLRHAAAAAAVAATMCGVLLAPSSAGADPLGDARARASALAATVDRLQTRAELATEHYDKVESALGAAVTERVLAERQVEVDQQKATAAADLVDGRVRALYESGGRASLMATVLDGSDPTDCAARMHVVGTLLGAGDSDISAAQATVAKSTQTANQLATASSKVTAASAAGRRRRRSGSVACSRSSSRPSAPPAARYAASSWPSRPLRPPPALATSRGTRGRGRCSRRVHRCTQQARRDRSRGSQKPPR